MTRNSLSSLLPQPLSSLEPEDVCLGYQAYTLWTRVTSEREGSEVEIQLPPGTEGLSVTCPGAHWGCLLCFSPGLGSTLLPSSGRFTLGPYRPPYPELHSSTLFAASPDAFTWGIHSLHVPRPPEEWEIRRDNRTWLMLVVNNETQRRGFPASDWSVLFP